MDPLVPPPLGKCARRPPVRRARSPDGDITPNRGRYHGPARSERRSYLSGDVGGQRTTFYGPVPEAGHRQRRSLHLARATRRGDRCSARPHGTFIVPLTWTGQAIAPLGYERVLPEGGGPLPTYTYQSFASSRNVSPENKGV